MNLLVLKGFNNYFNRIIKRYTTLADYISHSESHYDFANINFNPNDGVTTTQILGSENQKDAGGPDLVPLAWEKDGNPDYIIAYETEQVGIATVQVIRSRWFIIESVRTRNGQYSLKLKRDSIADHLDTLVTAPAFIKKGTVSDDNPLVVNSEGVTVNQIKSGETLLKDKTGSAWIVGYLSKDFVDKSDPDNPISVQVPDGDYESITIEDLSDELDVSAGVLEQILVTDPDNQVRFVNDYVEIVAWLNVPDNSNLEQKITAKSTNDLVSFSSGSQSQPPSDYNKTVAVWKPSSAFTNPFTFNAALGAIKPVYNNWLAAVNSHRTTLKSNWSTYTGHPYLSKKVYNKLVDLQKNGTLIYKAGLYYQIEIGSSSVVPTGETYSVGQDNPVMSSIISDTISTWNNSSSWLTLEARNSGQVFINYNELTANIYLTNKLSNVNVPTASVNISTSRNGVLNQPFDMFAMPFNDTLVVNGNDEYEVTGDYAQKLAIALMATETKGQIYDLQLLPYCPIPEIAETDSINITGKSENYDYNWIDYTGPMEVVDTADIAAILNEYSPGDYEAIATYQSTVDDTDLVDWGWDAHANTTNPEALEEFELWKDYASKRKTVVGGKSKFEVYGQVQDEQVFEAADVTVTIWFKYNTTGTVHRSIIVYPKRNSFSVALDYNLTLKESMKIDSQTDLYRLVSPNYQGSFDFNVAKNGGAVNGFIADCTYKPYTPYIKVAPNFSWLYGSNYGDCRGLICGGDFSIGFYSDIWQEYQLQNKNYQNIFNREIQNLDVNQSIQRTQQYVSGGLNIVRDTIAGGVGGGLATGSPYGAIAGAAIGGAGSAIGYGVDMNLMERSLQEQRQFSIDKFKMQLENIQALPYTLTKVGAFNINSKVFPFLEYYTCSEQEKEALKLKIQYEGMTVGVVDILGNYMGGGYVQADLIRNESIIEDSHLLDDIYIELTKGVYM